MKKIFALCLLACGAMSMSSCLNFDEPGDELEMNQQLYKYNPSTNSDTGGDNTDTETPGQD